MVKGRKTKKNCTYRKSMILLLNHNWVHILMLLLQQEGGTVRQMSSVNGWYPFIPHGQLCTTLQHWYATVGCKVWSGNNYFWLVSNEPIETVLELKIVWLISEPKKLHMTNLEWCYQNQINTFQMDFTQHPCIAEKQRQWNIPMFLHEGVRQKGKAAVMCQFVYGRDMKYSNSGQHNSSELSGGPLRNTERAGTENVVLVPLTEKVKYCSDSLFWTQISNLDTANKDMEQISQNETITPTYGL